jgi:DNA 3'-phosphatase
VLLSCWKGNTKIASFDLDGTLIVPKSQSKYPSVRSDWKWLFPEVKTKLQQLHNEGWKIVIFSNQAGVEKGHENLNHITGKIIDLASEVSKFDIIFVFEFGSDMTTNWIFLPLIFLETCLVRISLSSFHCLCD